VNLLRLAFAVAGFVLALISIALNDDRLGWAAIAMLLVSLFARLTLRKRIDSGSDEAGSDHSSPL
jgi:hypothetical protein